MKSGGFLSEKEPTVAELLEIIKTLTRRIEELEKIEFHKQWHKKIDIQISKEKS